MTRVSPLVEDPLDMTSTPALPGFAELYERHYEAVYRAALRVTGSPADAQDIVQTVFLRILSRKESAPAGYRGAYFTRAAVNAAVDLLRRRVAHGETAFDDGAPHAAVESPALLKERLRRAVAALDGEDASLFLLRHVEGLSLEELAAVFHLQKNNIAVRLHRIRRRLQTEMER